MRKYTKFIISSMFGLAVATWAQSQPSTSSSQASSSVDPAGAALFEAALDLMLPSAARSSVHSALVSGTVISTTDASSVVGTFTVKFADSNFQMESLAASHRRRLSYVNGVGRADNDGALGPAKNSGVSDLYSDVFPLLDAWSSYRHSGIGVGTSTDAVIEGTPCNEIKLRFPSRVPLFLHPTHDVRVFIDKSKGLVVAIDYPATQTQSYSDQIRMRVIYGEYRLIDGVYTPTLIRRFLNGQSLPVLRITDISIHQTFNAADLTF